MERRELRDVHLEGREKGEGRREREKRGRRERKGRRRRKRGMTIHLLWREREGGGREDPLVDVKHEGTANEHNWPSFPISPSHKGCIPTSVLAPTDNKNSTTASWPA